MRLADVLFEAILGGVITSVPAPPASDPVAVAVTFQGALPGLTSLSAAERALLSEWLTRAVDQLS